MLKVFDKGDRMGGFHLDCSGDGGTGNCSVSAHYFLELGLRETVGDLKIQLRFFN